MSKVRAQVQRVCHCEGCKQPIYIVRKADGVILAAHEGAGCIHFMCQTKDELLAQLGLEGAEGLTLKPLSIEVLP